MNKCKGCEWYGKPYWSIINPCENCPREETNVEIITRWIDPTIEEKDKEIERLKKQSNNYAKRIIKAIEYIETQWKKESYYDDIDNCLKQMLITEYDKDDLLEILRGEDNE